MWIGLHLHDNFYSVIKYYPVDSFGKENDLSVIVWRFENPKVDSAYKRKAMLLNLDIWVTRSGYQTKLR